MEQNELDGEFGQWFSTYGVITSQRILGHYQISLPQKELLSAIKNPKSFYHKLVQVPLRNVLNGIILQQANDYHIYTQKLFIDYLLSGESGKSVELQGASTREILEDDRKALVILGEEFNQKQLDHEALINITQKNLIRLTKELKEHFTASNTVLHAVLMKNGVDVAEKLINEGLTHALISCGMLGALDESSRLHFIDIINEVMKISLNTELKNALMQRLNVFFEALLRADKEIKELIGQAHEMTEIARSYRAQFYNTALKVIELIKLLPEYRLDATQDGINRESLYFDSAIGEKI